MPNRMLNKNEIAAANQIVDQICQQISTLAMDDPQLHFAYRRKIYKELIYKERGTPTQRRRLKKKKHSDQHGLCIQCAKSIPVKYSELDRLEAWKGYTEQNTRLVCHECHV